MRDLTADEREIVAGGWAFDEYRGEDGGGDGWAGEVVITARRGDWRSTSTWWKYLHRPTPQPPSDDSGGGGSDSPDPYSEDGAPGGGAADSAKAEMDKRAEKIGNDLQEVEVNASRCGIPQSELLSWGADSPRIWEKCLNNLPQNELKNLKIGLDLIVAGLTVSPTTLNPVLIAFGFLTADERQLVKDLSVAVATKEGGWFGQNMISLSKGSWESQIILKLIEGLFTFTTEREDRDN